MRVLAIALFFLAWPLLASHAEDVDPYNTLLWNREAALNHSSDIDRNDWYEWWYYKVVDPETQDAFFFTYGVVNPWDSEHLLGGTRSMIAFGDFRAKLQVADYERVQEFSAAYDHTEVHVGQNTATDNRITGNLAKDGHRYSWDLSISREWQFNAMGWTRGLRGASGIYWYPAQASAHMNGWISVDGQIHSLKNAPAYQDRNWGRSFPEWWTWLTSNNFKNSPGTVLAAGGGRPKLLNSFYLLSGLCIGLRYEGKEYVFRSFDGDKVNFDIHWGTWEVSAENKSGEKLEISAYAPPEKFLILPFETPRGETFYDYEALLGSMKLKLSKRSGLFGSWKVLAELESNEAGIEWGVPEPIGQAPAEYFKSLFGTHTSLQ